MDANDDKKGIDYDLEMEADDHNIQTEKPPCELFPKRDYDYKEEDEGDEMEFDSDNDLEMSYDNNQAVMDTSLEMSNTAIYDPNTQAEIPLCELFGEQDYEDEDSDTEFKDEYEDEEAYEKYRDSLWRVQWNYCLVSRIAHMATPVKYFMVSSILLPLLFSLLLLSQCWASASENAELVEEYLQVLNDECFDEDGSQEMKQIYPDSLACVSVVSASISPEPIIYTPLPEVSCRFNQIEKNLFELILKEMPNLRSHISYTVSTMQDLRYIGVVLKPGLGPLFRFYRFEYDWEAILRDCSSGQDLVDYKVLFDRIRN